MSIKFHFQKGGKVTIHPTGYPGNMCHDATRPYEEAFGGVQKTEEGEGDDTVAVPEHQQQEEHLGR